MRKFVLGFIIGMICMIPITAFGQTTYEKISAYFNPDIKVEVEGELLNLDLAPIVYDQRTYLPVRELIEKVMGYEVDWVQETTTVVITPPDIWPVKDSLKEGDVVDKEINFSDWGYDVFYEIDESLEPKEIKEMIKRIESKIRQHESVMRASTDPRSSYYNHPGYVEAFRVEMEKLREVLPKWEQLLETKLQDQESQIQN